MNCLLKPALYPAVEICDLTCERNVGIVFFFSCNLWGISGKIYVQWVLLAKKVLIVIIQWWKVYADNILQKILKGLDILDFDIFKWKKWNMPKEFKVVPDSTTGEFPQWLSLHESSCCSSGFDGLLEIFLLYQREAITILFNFLFFFLSLLPLFFPFFYFFLSS